SVEPAVLGVAHARRTTVFVDGDAVRAIRQTSEPGASGVGWPLIARARVMRFRVAGAAVRMLRVTAAARRDGDARKETESCSMRHGTSNRRDNLALSGRGRRARRLLFQAAEALS